MKRASAIALCFLGIAFPACAQHGGGHAGGHASFGGASHGSFSGRPAFSSAPARSFAPSRNFAASRFAPGAAYGRFPRYGNAFTSANRYAARPEYSRAYPASRSGNGGYGDHHRRYRPAYTPGLAYGYAGYGYPYLGWGDPYLTAPYLFDDSDDTDSGDNTTAYPNQAYGPGPDQSYDQSAGQYGPQPPYQAPYGPSPYGQGPYATGPNESGAYRQGNGEGPNPGQYSTAPAPYRGSATPPAQPAPSVSSASDSGSAVTLVFKDGRPPQQIHNYILSRTTLSVLDHTAGQHQRAIPVDDLDLPATERANRDAGVNFQLPR